MEREKVQEMMERFRIPSVPLLNKRGEITKIVFLHETPEPVRKQIHVPVVIMAGGKGTRLYPYTQILPKPLIPIGEKAITEHIIDHFMVYGCTQSDMIVNYKKILLSPISWFMKTI